VRLELPADLEDYLRETVATGEFASEEAILADALRLHRERAVRLRSLRLDLREAVDSLDRGEGRLVATLEDGKAFLEELERRGRERLGRGEAG
jgi:Arc/MetJ-type ribon-helix-helix transcriptional regulator